MSGFRQSLLVAAVATLAAFPMLAQSGPSVSIRAGVAVTNRYGNTAREAGPDLGAGLVFWSDHRVAIEMGVNASIFGTSVAEPDCAPDLPDPGGCVTHVGAPGPVLGAALSAVVRASGRVGLFAGLGFSASGSFPDEPTVEHRNTVSVQTGLRWRPFSGGRRGMGLELRAVRYTRGIGEVRTVLNPSLSWAF